MFLDELRSQVKDRGFRPLPVREWMIPKAGGKLRRLGITAMRDRVVQASLKLALEPILEADSRSPDRLAENVAAADVELTKEDLDRVNETPRTARTAAATRRR